MKHKLLCLAVTLVLLLGLTVSPALAQPIEPPEVSLALKPGESVIVQKTVTTPEIPPMLDFLLIVDLSGSYWNDLPVIRGLAPDLFDDIVASASDVQFGLASFVDYPFIPWGYAPSGDYAYQVEQDFTTDKDTWTGAVDDMVTRNGYDTPESQYEALYQAATGAGRLLGQPGNLGDIAPDPLGWRAGATKVIAITTDAPFHEAGDGPFTIFPGGYPGPTRDETVAALNAEGIIVIAIKAPGAGAQMDDIADATGGSVHTTSATSDELADAVLAGLAAIKTDVWATVEADPGLIVTFEPAVHEDVESGTTVYFKETITVACDARCGTVLTAVVTFWANSYPEEGASIGEQVIKITVLCGDEGLSPGYWKNNAERWGAVSWEPTGYCPGDQFSDVFGVVIEVRAGGRRTITDPTLLQALNATGGGVNALARAAVAALLNAAHADINYPVSENCVIAWTSAAIISGDAAKIEALYNKLDAWNNLGGGLDMHGNPI